MAKSREKAAKRWVNELLSIINKEETLASISVNMLDKIIKDGRVSLFQVTDKKQRKLVLNLIEEYSEQEIPNSVLVISNVFFYRHRKIHWQYISAYDKVDILFKILIRFDELEINETIEIPFFYYVAAVYDKFTIDMVQEHVREIDSNYYTESFQSKEKQINNYLSIMKQYNKKLPDDLKLWLKLR
jgi:hypothetical protein